MSGQDQLTLRVDQMLKDLTFSQSRPSMYRVSDDIRSTNEKAYDPKIIAIGPFHRDKPHLKKMDPQKRRYLKLLLDYKRESTVDRYVKAIRVLEPRARECYAEEVTLDKDEFVHMLLLDGIFILQFLREYCWRQQQIQNGQVVDDENNPIFHLGNIKNYVMFDLVLFENQIPLFILEKLFELSKSNDQEKMSDLVRPLLSSPEMLNGISFSSGQAHHLLGLVHYIECLSFAQRISRRRDTNKGVQVQHIDSATELNYCGVRFIREWESDSDPSRSYLDIRFLKGVENKIWIPTLDISDGTESRLRNMIAFEYYLPHNAPKYVTDYTFFMCNLIQGSEDAQLLRRFGIISNWLGGAEMVYFLLNQVGTNLQISDKFSYSDVFSDLNDHCRLGRNKWMAVLRRDYFNSPWVMINFIGAVVLSLTLSIVQTMVAVLSYSKFTTNTLDVYMCRDFHFHSGLLVSSTAPSPLGTFALFLTTQGSTVDELTCKSPAESL